MKTRRTVGALLALLLAILLLTGCHGNPVGGGAGAGIMNNNLSMTDQDFSESVSGWDDKYASGEAVPSDMPMTDMKPVDSGAADLDRWMPDNLKVIYTAYISLESENYDKAVDDLRSLVNENQGWLEAIRSDSSGTYRQVNYTVRVPADKFYTFCDQVGTVCSVTNLEQNAQDVSEAYYDTEARLTTERTKLERLQKLLSEADSMETIVALESSISDTEYEIEMLTGSLRHYDSLVGYSTIEISLREVYQVSPEEEPVHTFGDRIGRALSRGTTKFVTGVQDLLIALAESWANWLVLIAVAAVIVVMARRGSRKRQEKLKARGVKPLDTPSEATTIQNDKGDKKNNG